MASSCASHEVGELVAWEQRCGRSPPAAQQVAGSAPADPRGTPVPQWLRNLTLGEACTPRELCAQDAQVLQHAIQAVLAHYLRPLEPSLLEQAATGALRVAAADSSATSSSERLTSALENLVALLDSHSGYWILSSEGNTLAQGPRGDGLPGKRQPTPGVQWRLLPGGIGYAAIGRFERQTGKQLQEAIQGLAIAYGADLNGLVLDLRNSSGGLLGVGASVADLFLTGGLIAHTEGPNPEAQLRFEADDQDIVHGAPLAILVNRSTASTAELVAGSLQDRGRALLLGTPSFGKGTMQTLFLVDCRIVLRLTTARYYLPSGRWIGATGLRPDILVTSDPYPAAHPQPADPLSALRDKALSTAPICPSGSSAADAVLDCALQVLRRLAGDG